MNRRRLFPLGCVAGLLAVVSTGWAQEWRAAATFTQVDNLGRASTPADHRDAFVGHAELAASGRWLLSPDWTLLGGALAQATVVPEFADLGGGGAGGWVEARRKLGLGPFAPVFLLRGEAGGAETGVPGADRWHGAATARLTRRLSERWLVSTAAEWRETLASVTTFDTGHARLEAEAAWDVSPRWRIRGGGALLSGTFTANASPTAWQRALTGAAGAGVAAYYRTVPRHVTETYGPGWVTYRIRGDIRLWWVEVSPALTDQSALALRYENTLAENRADVRYRQDAWTLSWVQTW